MFWIFFLYIIVNFEFWHHKPLMLTLNFHHKYSILIIKFVMYKRFIEDTYDNKKHLILDKDESNIFLKDLNNELNILSNKENIENLYHNFMKTLSTSINKFII